MLYFERSYDLDELARRNMHIHSHYSHCAKPEMELKAIVAECERCGLTDIAIVDHSNIEPDGSITPVPETNKILAAERDALDTKLNIRIGSEVSIYGLGKLTETPENIRNLEYRLFAHNHYHLSYWEQPEDRSPAGYAKHEFDCLYWLFGTGLADCIAHPIVPVKLAKTQPDNSRVLEAVTDEALGDLMEAGEKAGCAWELHSGAVLGWPEFSRRYFNIGREVGVHFTFATDAHRIVNIDTSGILERFKQILL